MRAAFEEENECSIVVTQREWRRMRADHCNVCITVFFSCNSPGVGVGGAVDGATVVVVGTVRTVVVGGTVIIGVVGGIVRIVVVGGTVMGGSVTGGRVTGGTVMGATVRIVVCTGGTVTGGTVIGAIVRIVVCTVATVTGGTVMGGRVMGGSVRTVVCTGGTVTGGSVQSVIGCDDVHTHCVEGEGAYVAVYLGVDAGGATVGTLASFERTETMRVKMPPAESCPLKEQAHDGVYKLPSNDIY